MSIKYKIEFRVSKDPFLTPRQREMAQAIGSLLAISAPIRPAFFTFIILHQHYRTITQKEKILELYLKRMVISRKIDAYEEAFCKELEASFALTQENNNFVKFVSSIFEYYVEAIMQLTHGSSIIISSNVLINGNKFTAHGNNTVDLAIDKLDESSKILILAECCLTMRRLQTKTEQICFYAELLKTIREIVGGKAILKFEMIVANNERSNWHNVNFQSLDMLRDNDVDIKGRTLISEQVYRQF